MDEEIQNPDANTADASSKSATPDAKESTAAPSATENQDAKQTMTPLERATSIVDASSAAREKGLESKGEHNLVISTEDEKAQAKVQGKQNPPAPEVIDATKSGDERYDKIPRFKELLAKVKEHEPLVQRAQQDVAWMQQYNVSDAELSESKGFLQAIKTGDYARAHTMLKPLMERLEGLVGNVLPEDLQKAVDDGKVEITYAQELARTRARAGQGEQMLQRQTQQQLATSRQTAINTWVESTKKTDPDFDKKSQMVNTVFLTKWAAKQDASPQELAALCQQALDEVNTSLKQFIPAPPQRKLPSQNGSTTTEQNAGKKLSPEERAMAIVNKYYA